MTESSARSIPPPLLTRLFGIRPEEIAAVALSFTYFFCLLSGYYILRPIRETMATISGSHTIPYLFTGTFFAMMFATTVFGWIASRFPRKTFLPWVYFFFVANIALFYLAFANTGGDEETGTWLARTFFVWISVFNLFAVSVFWSFMADIYSKGQVRRLFGVISAGGSLGSIAGSRFTQELAEDIGTTNLLPISALLLLACVVCIYQLRKLAIEDRGGLEAHDRSDHRAMGGRALDGIRFVFSSPYFGAIALALFMTNLLGGVLYFYQIDLVSRAESAIDARTGLFAQLNFYIGILAMLAQALMVRVSVKRIGVGRTLMIVPLVSIIGFAVIALEPSLVAVFVLQGLRRGIGFGFTKPTTDMLYSVATTEERYKAKNFIETAVYRGSDVVTGYAVRFFNGLVGISWVAWICVPLAVIAAGLAAWIGRQYQRRFDRIAANPDG